MTDARRTLTDLAGRRITAIEISEILGVSRNTAQARLAEGLPASDVITISRAIAVNPVDALVELGWLTYEEASAFLDADGTTLATATEEQLLIELVERQLPARLIADLSRRAAERLRGSNVTPLPQIRPVVHDDLPEGAVADHSPDYEEENNEFDD